MRAGLLIIASLCSILPAARAAIVAVDPLDAKPAVAALNELRRPWIDQLNELIAATRALAVADDTYEFMKRPNIPYVNAHYDLERLAAERIDTVLIVDLHGRPLFWRRVNQGDNRGFPDARRFLAELPPLPAPGAAGVPGLAGAVALVHGPKLLAAMPIYGSHGSGIARGWLIATRALDALQWRRYQELAQLPVQILDPHPQTGGVQRPIEPPKAGAGYDSDRQRGPLRARLAASHAVHRYQPQIDLQTGRVAGVEAILCVPVLREHRPAIGLAAEIEAAGLGLALAEHRLRDACREQRMWLKVIGHDFPIGVPVSRSALADAAFIPLVHKILADHELTTSHLEIQVEDAALGPSAAALTSLSKNHDAGLSIAVDAFNAGHSNLRVLSSLPITKLRLDPRVLRRVSDNPSEARLLDGIIGAARAMGIVLCATGVDSPESLSAIIQHGRPLAQGAALGPPLPAAEFLELLRASWDHTAMLRPLDLGEECLEDTAVLRTVALGDERVLADA